MRSLMYILFSLLIAGLLVQNTCPHGFAGKSTVASTCSYCPQKQDHKKVPAGNAFSSITKAPTHLPMYVLDMPNTKPVFKMAAIATPQPVIPNTYKNAAPDELFQPPRA